MPESSYLLRVEHEEYVRRMEDEHQRISSRLEVMEKAVGEMHSIAASVEVLANNMQAMVKEQEKQGRRLEALEGRDGESWRKVSGYVVTTVVGLVLGYLLRLAGIV